MPGPPPAPATAGAAGAAESHATFLWDGNVLLAEGTAADPLATVYLYEPGTFRPLAQIRRGPGGDAIYRYPLDLVGTPQELTNDDGRVVWRGRLRAWGALAAEPVAEVPQPLRFQGQYADTETGLHYNRFRYYAPAEGCYVHQDPIGLAGGWNRAGYVGDPAQWIDPLGLACQAGDPNAVKPYETGTYKDLSDRSVVGDNLAIDHQPSNASNIARTEAQLGRPLTPAEASAVRNNGQAVAVPQDWHTGSSLTYGGRNTPAQIAADAADPVGAATRDSQAMVEGASPANRTAAQNAAATIQQGARGL